MGAGASITSINAQQIARKGRPDENLDHLMVKLMKSVGDEDLKQTATFHSFLNQFDDDMDKSGEESVSAQASGRSAFADDKLLSPNNRSVDPRVEGALIGTRADSFNSKDGLLRLECDTSEDSTGARRKKKINDPRVQGFVIGASQAVM